MASCTWLPSTGVHDFSVNLINPIAVTTVTSAIKMPCSGTGTGSFKARAPTMHQLSISITTSLVEPLEVLTVKGSPGSVTETLRVPADAKNPGTLTDGTAIFRAKTLLVASNV